MSVNGFAPSAVRSYLSAISFNLKIQGLSDLTDNFIIKKMIGGYRKLNKICNIRKPITLDILIQLSDALLHICSSKYEVVMFKAAFTLTFSAFLRVGEILLNTLDITLDENKGALYVHVRFSETDQAGKYTTLYLMVQVFFSFKWVFGDSISVLFSIALCFTIFEYECEPI